MGVQLEVTLVIFTVTIFQISVVEPRGLVEIVSDYAKAVKTQTYSPKTTTTESPLNDTSDDSADYEDFDDLPENRSFDQSSSAQTMMKYFNGIVSLLTLMYRFNGKFDGLKSQDVNFKNLNWSRKRIREANDHQAFGKRFHEAQDRFEFPQKKFRYHENAEGNSADQQFQSLENYPPYNPLEANTAETYNQDDKKTSYESDLIQYDSEKNNYGQSSVEVQQSYSYEIPYETPKPIKPSTDKWKNQIHPIYEPWMSERPGKGDPVPAGDSYLPWSTNTKGGNQVQPQDESHLPWSSTIDIKPSTYWKGEISGEEAKPVSKPRQPWKGKIPAPDITILHHPEDTHDEHHFQYHEIVPADEDRVSKKPYSYYFLGRKLWYIPLLFSVYFIIYVGALVLKSVARHKIQFPEKIWNLHDDHFGHGSRRRQHRKIDEITENYEKAIQKSINKFM